MVLYGYIYLNGVYMVYNVFFNGFYIYLNGVYKLFFVFIWFIYIYIYINGFFLWFLYCFYNGSICFFKIMVFIWFL